MNVKGAEQQLSTKARALISQYRAKNQRYFAMNVRQNAMITYDPSGGASNQ
jgi:hypothetical protein